MVVQPLLTQGKIMRNIKIAIAAVVCLQVSFQVFMAIDRSNDRFFALNGSDPVSGIPVKDISPVDLPDFNFAENEPVHVVKRVQRSEHVYHMPEPNFAAVRVRTVQKVRPLELVAKKIEPSAPSQVQSRETPLLKTVKYTETPQKKEKPLIAKVLLPVFKKPYSWIKALAVRL
jgi:hypothetical protein